MTALLVEYLRMWCRLAILFFKLGVLYLTLVPLFIVGIIWLIHLLTVGGGIFMISSVVGSLLGSLTALQWILAGIVLAGIIYLFGTEKS